jgi:hypothetical protein
MTDRVRHGGLSVLGLGVGCIDVSGYYGPTDSARSTAGLRDPFRWTFSTSSRIDVGT